MATFLASVVIMVTVVGGLVTWMLREERRRRVGGEVDGAPQDEQSNVGRPAPAGRRSHAGDHR